MPAKLEIPKWERFSRLRVIGEKKKELRKDPKKREMVCLCDCGQVISVPYGRMKSGGTKSCGCLRKEKCEERGRSKVKLVEGVHSGNHPLQRTWSSMKNRCYNENSEDFKNYGERGIIVCERWRISFENFVSDMGPRPDGFSIDRIDNNGDYEPGNCRWASSATQSRNRRSNKKITFNGESQCISVWARRLGGNRDLVFYRLKLGWSEEDAVSTPVGARRRSK